MEDKLKVGQLVQKLAIEKANRRKFEDKLCEESQTLEQQFHSLQQEQQKLLREKEFLQESVTSSISQIEFLNNTPSLSLNTPIESKMITPETSVYSIFKDSSSTSISVQTDNDREIETLNKSKVEVSYSRKRNYEKDSIRKILEKAHESSIRIEKILSPECSIYEELPCYRKTEEMCSYSVEKGSTNETTFVKQQEDLSDHENMLIIEESFYDAGILDVINEMEDYQDFQ